MRDRLVCALAKHVGRTLTTELASEIVSSSVKPLDLAPVDPEQVGEWSFQTETIRESNDLAFHRILYLAECFPNRGQRTDWTHLMERQAQNTLWIFTARCSGELAASIWLNVGTNIDTGELAVSDDLIYVAKPWRGSKAILSLWRFAEKAMFARGIREATFSMRIDSGTERMARFMGYTPAAIRVHKAHYGERYEDAPTRHLRRGIHHEQT